MEEEASEQNSSAVPDPPITVIDTVMMKNHPFDLQSCEQVYGVCDFPVKKKVNQIRGEFGPRHYNRITVSQQIAQISNVSVKNIV